MKITQTSIVARWNADYSNFAFVLFICKDYCCRVMHDRNEIYWYLVTFYHSFSLISRKQTMFHFYIHSIYYSINIVILKILKQSDRT